MYVRLDKDGIMMLGSKKLDVDSSDYRRCDMLAYRVFTSLFSKEFPTMTCVRKVINENTKVYCWLQTHIDAITPSTVIYGVTGNISIDM